MSLDRTSLRFESETDAERWFGQLREQWIVLDTDVQVDPVLGGVVATAECATEGGALCPSQR
jgi:hypothetical protein